MRKTLGTSVLSILLTISISAGVMQNDSQAPPPPPAPTPQVTPTPLPDGVMQNDYTGGLTAEIVMDLLLGVLALY